jgi:hypothetical protein
METFSENERLRLQLQEFVRRLNEPPKDSELRNTPDNKAKFLPISFIETELDELFLGMWSTENFKWSGIGNEVQGSLELVLTHPITGKEIRRVGAGSIVIMVDALNDQEKAAMTKQERNIYAISPENKKPNAMDMAFPKLKTECLKNAAQSLGKRFGRDINRRENVDQFQAKYLPLGEAGFQTLIERAGKGELNLIAIAETTFVLTEAQKQALRSIEPIPAKQLNGAH